MNRTSLSTLRADAALRRDQILDAADAVFAEQGVTAPLDLVVARAGVGRATLYRNFPDRAALVEACFARAMETLEAQADGMDLFALLESVSRLCIVTPALSDYWRALAPDAADAPAVPGPSARLARLFRKPLAAALAEGSCRADLKPNDLVLACGMLGAALRGADPGRRRALARRSLALLHAGLRAPGGDA